MTTGPETREPEYSSDIAGDVDCLARGRAPFDPLAAPGGAATGTEVGADAAARLDVRVTVRVPAGEAARWREQAQAAGVSVSDWLRGRAAADEASVVVTGRPTPRRRVMGRARVVRADPAVIEQLARIGNNLNQLARWANTERRAADVATLYGVGRQLALLREAVVTASAGEQGAEAEVVVDLVEDLEKGVSVS